MHKIFTLQVTHKSCSKLSTEDTLTFLWVALNKLSRMCYQTLAQFQETEFVKVYLIMIKNQSINEDRFRWLNWKSHVIRNGSWGGRNRQTLRWPTGTNLPKLPVTKLRQHGNVQDLPSYGGQGGPSVNKLTTDMCNIGCWNNFPSRSNFPETWFASLIVFNTTKSKSTLNSETPENTGNGRFANEMLTQMIL